VDPGRWPDYNVNWADVDVGTEQRTITVPVVSVQQKPKEVTVPFIRITPPGGGQAEERTVSVGVDVPTAGYALQIAEVRASRDDLWVIAELRQTDGPAAQALTRVEDQVVVQAPEDLDIRKVIVGQRPSGVSNHEFRFLDSMSAVDQQLPNGARVIYRRGSGGPG
jgi:hypothetical protein